MPIPFDRFRLLNDTGRDISRADYGKETEATMRPENTFAPIVSLGVVPTSQFVEDAPLNEKDIKNIGLSIDVAESAPGANDQRTLPLWQIFYPEDPGYTEANEVRMVEVVVSRYPGAGGAPDPNEFFATALVTLGDNTTWEFFSPKFGS